MSEDLKIMLWVGAFRYWCGRQTIAVHSFCDELICSWPDIPEQAKHVIRRDLKERIIDDDRARRRGSEFLSLGHDVDRAKWLTVYDFIQKDNP